MNPLRERSMTQDPVDISLQRTPLNSAAAVARVTCREAGGIALFLGTTRAQNDPAKNAPPGGDLGPLLALDYHAYEEMAQSQMRKLSARAAAQWPVCRIVIWHRLGEVKVGQPSVIVAVSCPHRGQAFDACEFLIDELKKTAPIWKREIYERGTQWQ
jgi:molybdopterin synthase catalytic subunit